MAQSAANRVYQDFDPFFEWTEDEASVTLVVLLPGFTAVQLRARVTSTAVLRINGERQVVENVWRRFGKEFSIPPNCDTNGVSAEFEHGVLSVKFPKLITPAKPQQQEAITDPPEEAPIMPQQQEAPISETPQVNINTPEAQGKQRAKMILQRLKTRILDFDISLGSAGDQDVNQGFGGGAWLKRWRISNNMIVAMLLLLVLGVYVKNAFWSSQSSQGESKFQEF